MREIEAHGFVANASTLRQAGTSCRKTLTFVRPRGFFIFPAQSRYNKNATHYTYLIKLLEVISYQLIKLNLNLRIIIESIKRNKNK